MPRIVSSDTDLFPEPQTRRSVAAPTPRQMMDLWDQSQKVEFQRRAESQENNTKKKKDLPPLDALMPLDSAVARIKIKRKRIICPSMWVIKMRHCFTHM